MDNKAKYNNPKSFCINLFFLPVIPVLSENVLLFVVDSIMLPTRNFVLNE